MAVRNVGALSGAFLRPITIYLTYNVKGDKMMAARKVAHLNLNNF